MSKLVSRPGDNDDAAPTVDLGGPRRGRRITVVNDNPEFLDLMRDVLANERYRVTAINGEQIESIDPIRASDPELLFIDLRLHHERITGWEIAMAVRNDDHLRHVPVIVCTAAADEVRERAEDLAALPNVEILVKPFMLQELEALVDRHLPDLAEEEGAAPPPLPSMTEPGSEAIS
jgi:CheY-like chemotaxis protein